MRSPSGQPAVALEFLGCQLNQAEMEAIGHQFRDRGFRVVREDEPADVYVLNTCSVTHVADRKSRHLLRLRRQQVRPRLVVATGCYASHTARRLLADGLADLVVDNRQKPTLVPLVQRAFGELLGEEAHRESPAAFSAPIATHPLFRTRSMVKIQEGCDEFCTYCIIPFTRGREQSVPADQILATIQHRVRNGAREVILTGTLLGSYGLKLRRRSDGPEATGPSLADLVRRVLEETGVERLCRHLHMPLQHGSADVLQRMRRPYARDDFEAAVLKIRRAYPDMAISTDVIVGFPGETHAAFEECLTFCEAMAFSSMHVFPFSSRPGTAAARLAGHVADEVKRERTRAMLGLAERLALDYRRRFVGRTMDVLWEGERQETGRGAVWVGLTGNHLRVYAQSDRALANELLPTRLLATHEKGLWGELAVPDREGAQNEAARAHRIRD